jgi:ribosome-associated translation inhibitor RaiA
MAQQGTMGFAEPPPAARRARARAKVLEVAADVLDGIDFVEPNLAREARRLKARLRRQSKEWDERASERGFRIPEGLG